MMTRDLYRLLALFLLAASLQSCSSRAIVLYSVSADPAESGRQWVWPYFLEAKPTVVAFWNTDNMQCLRDVAALRTLQQRNSGVELVTVVTGINHYEVEKWLQKESIRYVVLTDFSRQLAARLEAHGEPLFIYFDADGEEISRSYDVRTVHNWFDRPRWLEESGAQMALGAALRSAVQVRERAPRTAMAAAPVTGTPRSQVIRRSNIAPRRRGDPGVPGGRVHGSLGGRGRRH
jgi:hypothetical protein